MIHLFAGFMKEPGVHFHALAKAATFCKVPVTRNC